MTGLRVAMLIFGLAVLMVASVVMVAQEPDAPHDITQLWATIVEWEDGSSRYTVSRVHPVSGTTVPLATGPGGVREMTWSPDGQWLHFAETGQNSCCDDRYVHWTGWEPPRPRVDPAWFRYYLTVSPDEQWVGIFRWGTDGRSTPYVRPINTDDLGDPLMTPMSVATYAERHLYVHWSPDSEWIYITDLVEIDDEYQPVVRRVHRTGRDYQHLITFENATYVEQFIPGPEWLLVTVQENGTGNSIIYRISFAGSDVQVFEPEERVKHMWLLPSGAVMVVLYDTQGLWRIESDFQSMTPLQTDYHPVDFPPIWSPNERHMAAFAWNWERGLRYLLVMEPDGENLQIVQATRCTDYNDYQLPPYWIADAVYFTGTEDTTCRLMRMQPGDTEPEIVHVFPHDSEWIQLLPDTDDVTWVEVQAPAESYLLRADGGQKVSADLPRPSSTRTWTHEPMFDREGVHATRAIGGLALGIGTLGIWWRRRRQQ